MTRTPPPRSIVRMSDEMHQDARELHAVEASLKQMDQRAAAAREILSQVDQQYPQAQIRRQELIDSISIAQEVLEEKCAAHSWETPAPPAEPATPANGIPLPIEQEARDTYTADPTVTGASPVYRPETSGQFPQVNGVPAHA